MTGAVFNLDRSPRLEALHGYDILDTPPEPAFDDMAALAAQLCDAPVALVSLVDADRQWFKARLGFPECETDLDRSVCRFVVETRDMVIVPDMQADPRTAENPLVTGEPHVRFYAGAPLVTTDGHMLGALCVLDTAARPAGLTPAQQRALSALARRTVEVIETRQLAKERDRADAEREASEHRWAALFQNLSEGFILGHVVRDHDGRIRDWRYEQVNAAWGRLVGVEVEDAIGRTIREVFPGIEDAWVDEFITVVETGEPIRFTRQVGSLGRWYDGVAQPAGPDRFTVLFLEVTDRIERERRQAALVELGDRLRDETSIEGVTAAVCSVLGRTLGADLVGYGDVDASAETIRVQQDWTSAGAESAARTVNFRDFGSYIEDLKRGDTVVIGDSRIDARTRDSTERLESRNARAFVASPVFERGTFVALLYVTAGQARDWSGEEVRFICDIASRLRLTVERVRAERQQDVLNGEISHRLKNSLAMVQAIANQTLRDGTDPEQLKAFGARLTALGSAHDALLGRGLQSADLAELLGRVTTAVGVEERVRMDGPAAPLGDRATLSASLLLHELITNALKYGSLSGTGDVLVSWRFEEGQSGRELVLEWRERGGPPATPPARQGFGSRLLRLGLVGTGGSHVNYGPDGFHGTFRSPMKHLGST